MSSHQYIGNGSNSRQGDIEHSTQLAEHLGSLCCNKDYSDITFIIEGKKLYAHKVWMSTPDLYFCLSQILFDSRLSWLSEVNIFVRCYTAV